MKRFSLSKRSWNRSRFLGFELLDQRIVFSIEAISLRSDGLGGDLDWFFRADNDILTDQIVGEIIDPL